MTIGPQKQPFFSIHNPHCHDHVAAEWAAFGAYREFSAWPRHYQPMPGRPNGIDFDMEDMPITSSERGKPWVPAPGTTARFWVVYGGGLAVKIKLRKGQTAYHVDGGPTDEGYSYTTRTWHFDGDGVSLTAFTDARDCDGRIQHHHESYCLLRELAAGYCAANYGSTEHDSDTYSLRFPRWMPVKASQRDFAAEAAGY